MVSYAEFIKGHNGFKLATFVLSVAWFSEEQSFEKTRAELYANMIIIY